MPDATYWDEAERKWVDIAADRRRVEAMVDLPGEPAASLARLVLILLDRVSALERRNDRDDGYRREQGES